MSEKNFQNEKIFSFLNTFRIENDNLKFRLMA
jgi:hypothetical protein